MEHLVENKHNTPFKMEVFQRGPRVRKLKSRDESFILFPETLITSFLPDHSGVDFPDRTLGNPFPRVLDYVYTAWAMSDINGIQETRCLIEEFEIRQGR